jgi:hypothetical protein
MLFSGHVTRFGKKTFKKSNIRQLRVTVRVARRNPSVADFIQCYMFADRGGDQVFELLYPKCFVVIAGEFRAVPGFVGCEITKIDVIGTYTRPPEREELIEYPPVDREIPF